MFLTPALVGITCQKLDAPDYGSVSASDSTYGSKATYVCDHGYEMYGQDYRTCEYNGKWSGRAPTCKRKGQKFTHAIHKITL